MCWLMQIFPIDDTWSMQIWMAMAFLTYDRMWMIRCYGANHTVSLLMFIMILFRCLVSVINFMYIIRCKGHIKTHGVIVCLYLVIWWNISVISRSCNDLCLVSPLCLGWRCNVFGCHISDVSSLGWVMHVCIESFGDRKLFHDV